jgi:hypothetical protein
LFFNIKRILIIIFLLFSFSESSVNNKISIDSSQLNQEISLDIEQYYKLVEQSFQTRIKIADFYRNVETCLDSSGYLKAQYLHNIKQTTKEYMQTRKVMYEMIFKRENWLNDDSIPIQTRLKGIMLSLSAAIVLYDNYALALSHYQNNAHLRKIINTSDDAYHLGGNNLQKLAFEYNSIINKHKLKKAINFYKKNEKYISQYDEEMVYLQKLITQSYSYKNFAKSNLFNILFDKLKLYATTSLDTIGYVKDTSVNSASFTFGNIVGLISIRKGLMYGNKKEEEEISSQLKAGDILLEKTPFRLTDTLIPGYWGHAAIWVGTKEELIELGIWEHELVKPYQKEIESGNNIVEALRSGVELNPLRKFLNIDDMVTLRENDISKKDLKSLILKTFGQIGKDYDFNFDIETTDKIVCSELVYTTYTHLDWPTDKALGRYTISPDNIANKTNDSTLSVVSLYHNGKRVTQKEVLWHMMLEDNVK